jgi:hypothetical protein
LCLDKILVYRKTSTRENVFYENLFTEKYGEIRNKKTGLVSESDNVQFR